MSLEKKAENLLEAVTGLVNAITAMTAAFDNAAKATKGFTTKAETPPATDKKPTKKEMDALKKAAKQLAGKVLKELGKEKLADLLGEFGAKKFPELKADPTVINSFMEKAEAILADKTEDDVLLGVGPTESTKVCTLEDVRELLLKINNHADLGNDVTRQILADLGAARLGDLTKDKFAAAVEAAEKALAGDM